MGIIQRQSIKHSIVSYSGVIIGALSTFFIYSQAEEAYGLARFVLDTSWIIVPLILLGSSAVSVKFFPEVQLLGKAKYSFLFYLLTICAVGGILFSILFYLFQDDLMSLYENKEHFEMLSKYFSFILPLALLVAFVALLNAYIVNFKRIVVPAIFQQLFIKVSLPFLIGLVVWYKFDYGQMITGILITYVFALLGLVLYLIKLGRFDIRISPAIFIKLDQKRIFRYSAYSLFAGIGGVLAYRIDSYMISTLMDFSKNGVYNICLFMGSVIAIPTNSIMQISAPMISEALHNDEIERIDGWYKGASINLLVLGLIIFVLTTLSIEDLFSLMPKYESSITEAFWIIFLIGIAKLIDMAASINNQIIIYSKYFKFGLYAVLILAIINIVLNLVLIPEFEIIGAAMATLIAITLNNLMKFTFIYYKYNIQPFSINTVKVICVALICYGLGLIIPIFSSHILNILCKSIVVFSIYTFFIYKLKISVDINNIIDDILSKSRKILWK